MYNLFGNVQGKMCIENGILEIGRTWHSLGYAAKYLSFLIIRGYASRETLRKELSCVSSLAWPEA